METPSSTVRVSRATHQVLRDLAAESGATMAEILAQAVEDYRRRRYWDDVNAAYAALRADPAAWADHRRECEEWDVALGDGLEAHPH